MIGLLLKLENTDFPLQHLYLSLQLFVFLEHLASPFLIVFDLILEIKDLCANIFGSDEIGVHFNDALGLQLNLFYF